MGSAQQHEHELGLRGSQLEGDGKVYPRKTKDGGVCEVARSGHWCKVTIAKSLLLYRCFLEDYAVPNKRNKQRNSGFHVNLMPQVSLSVLDSHTVCPTR